MSNGYRFEAFKPMSWVRWWHAEYCGNIYAADTFLFMVSFDVLRRWRNSLDATRGRRGHSKNQFYHMTYLHLGGSHRYQIAPGSKQVTWWVNILMLLNWLLRKMWPRRHKTSWLDNSQSARTCHRGNSHRSLVTLVRVKKVLREGVKLIKERVHKV